MNNYNFIIEKINKNSYYKCIEPLNIDNLIILYKYKYKHCNFNNYIYSKNKIYQISFSNINIIYHHIMLYFFPLDFYIKNKICFVNDYYNNIDKINNYYFHYTFLKKDMINNIKLSKFDIIYMNNIKINNENIFTLLNFINNNLSEGGNFNFIINNNNIFYKKFIYILIPLFERVTLFHHELIDNVFVIFYNKLNKKIKNSYISKEFNKKINNFFYLTEQILIEKYKLNNTKNNYILYYDFLYNFSLMMSKKNNILTNDMITQIKNNRALLPFFFNGLNINRSIKYTPISLYSVTLPVNAHIISNIIKKDFPESKTITDATSNIGGNTLSFSLFFDNVNAIEYEEETFNYLKYNMNIYKRKNIKFYNEDYTKIMLNINEDIVYIDPPWSGINYKKNKELIIRLGNYNISNLIEKILNEKNVMGLYLKLPSNTKIDIKTGYKIIKIANFNLLCISKKNNKNK